jgi:aryl-alcohol dehydrogenase-like predicted oxidoreductase
MAQTYGLAIIPWSPLAGGLLTGKYQRGQEPPEGARFADQDNPLYRRRLNDRIYDVVDGLTPVAQEKGCTLSQLALAWVLHQPGVTSPIIGPRTMEQYDDNMKALDVEITDDDRRAINRVIRRGDSVAPFYEADFGPHQFRI